LTEPSPRLRALVRAFGKRLRAEAGIGLVEAVIAMSLFLIAGTALSDVLASSATSHGFAVDMTLGQEAADAQIEDVRALPYDSVGTTNGNPPGSVSPSQSAASLGVTGLAATVTTSIHFVGDGVPDGYNSTTNYKQVVVSVTRNSDGHNLATESTYIAPPTRAPYGGISQVALGVNVTDVGDNQPVSGVPIALQTGPSAPRNDTTDTNGGVLFAGMTANPSSGPTAYYNVVPTLPPGYVEMSGDVKQAQLGPGQITNLSIRVYQPATIYVHLTSGGSDYTGNATVTVTPKAGAAQNYSVGGDPGGQYTIPNVNPNVEYTVVASNSAGLISQAVDQYVPNDYPSDLTSSFNLDLAAPQGTLSVTTVNGTADIAGVAVTVTGGPSGVHLTGTTDANGVVNFPAIPAGSAPYTITGTYGAATFQQTGITVATNQPTPVTLGVAAGAVKVSVTDGASHPLSGATLTLNGPNGFSAVGTTDGTGTWTFPNVGTGSGYSVVATDGAATGQATAISVSTGVTTNVLLSLNVGTIKVTVTDGTNPVSGVPVTLTGPNSLVVIGTTDNSGVYSFTNIGAGGGYTVTANDGAATASASSLSVTSGNTTSVNLTIPVGSIQATVTEGGSPLPNAKVTVTGPNGYSVSLTANASGVATFTGVGTGSGYTVTGADGPATAQQTGVSVSSGTTTNVAVDISVGSIKVTVNAGSTGLSGINVSLTGANSYSASGVTDSTGVYTFAKVPVGGGFTVTATAGVASANQSNVSVASGATTHVTLAMPTGQIRASVMIGGTGLAGQTVTVTGPNSYSATGTTDATGLCVFANIPIGAGYTVATTYGTTVQQANQTVLKNGITDVLLTIPSGSLKVTVQNQSAVSIAGAKVTLSSTNGVTAAPGTTASNGTYTFSLPAASGYTVTAKDGAGSATSASQTVTTGNVTNVTLTLSTGSVQVTVKNSSGNISGANVTLTGPSSFSATPSSAAGGVYTFTNVPAGSGYSASATYGAATANATGLSVSSGTTTSATITIPSGSIAVTVKSAGGSNLSGASLTLSGPGSYAATGTTAPAGTYTFQNVPAGSGYSIAVTYGGGSANSSALSVTAGNTTSTTITIPTGSLNVTVQAGGVAAPGASLTLSGPGSYSATGTADASGTFSFTDVPAGAGYTVAATYGAGSASNATLTVPSSSTASTTVTISSGSIAVTVKNSGGTALNGATLALTGPGSYSANGSTGSGNTYTFTNVPIGASGYTVTATLGAGTGSTSGVVVSAPSPAKAATVTISTGTLTITLKNQGGTTFAANANYTLTGPNSYSQTSTTGTFSNVPRSSSTSYTVVANVGAGSGTNSNVLVNSSSSAANVTINTGTLVVTVKGASPSCSPVSGKTVTLTAANGYSVTSGNTPANGQVTFSNVPSGNPYTATASGGGGTKSGIVINTGSTTNATVSPSGTCP
jgi:Carboxypeptidase regulatory-like domain